MEENKSKYTGIPEKEQWDRAGCSNNAEWHDHLNELLWQEYDKG